MWRCLNDVLRILRYSAASCIFTLGCASVPVTITATPSSAQAIKFGAQIKSHITTDSGGVVVDQAFTSDDEANLYAANVQYVRTGLIYDSSFVANASDPENTGLNSPTLNRVADTVALLTHGEQVVLTIAVYPSLLASQAQQYKSANSTTLDQAVNAVMLSDLNLSVSLAKQKFGSRIYAIEIWNEPDGSSWWNTSTLGTFVNALAGICSSENAPSWGLPVWGYAFSVLPHAAGSSDTSAASAIYDSMYVAGEASCLSAISAHYYSSTPEGFPAQFTNASNSTHDLPVNLTEFGGVSMPSIRTEGQQAQLILRYMLTFLSASPRPEFTSIYEWKDSCYATTGAQQYYGVTRDSYCNAGSPEKPALTALEQLLPLETGVSYAGGTCGTGVVCSVTLKHSDYTYTVYWRSDAVATYLNSVVSDLTVDEKQLSTSDAFTSRVPSSVPINQIPRVIRRVTTQ